MCRMMRAPSCGFPGVAVARPLGPQFINNLTAGRQYHRLAGEVLPALDRDIDISRVPFDPVADATRISAVAINEISTAICWAPHSARGFISGALKKPSGRSMSASKSTKNGRIYKQETEMRQFPCREAIRTLKCVA